MRQVEVTWWDSKRFLDSWEYKDHVEVPDMQDLKVRSVGYVFEENDDLLVIVAHDGGDQVLHAIAIPRCAIFLVTEN